MRAISRIQFGLSGGGITRDANGEFRSNSEAEAFPLVNGLKLCQQLHLYELEVGSDSKLIVHVGKTIMRLFEE